MKTDNDIKSLLKSSMENNIPVYSNEQLNAMVIKCAKKSMWQYYPRWIIATACIALIILSGEVFYRISNANIPLVIFDLAIICLLIASIVFFIWQIKKMGKYSPDIPIKDWLERRIHWADREISIFKKYGILIDSIAYIIGLSVAGAHNYFHHGSFNLTAAIVSALTIFVILYVTKKMRNKHLHNILNSLQKLHSQLGE